MAERETADYFEAMLDAGAEAKAAANWLNNEYFGRLNKEKGAKSFTRVSADGLRQDTVVILEGATAIGKAGSVAVVLGPVSANANADIVKMVSDGTISGKIAKDLMDILWSEGGDPRAIVEARGLKQVTDTSAIEKVVDAVIAANPDKVEEVKAKPKLAAWFVGQVMKQSGGKANPQAVNAILKVRLNLPDEG